MLQINDCIATNKTPSVPAHLLYSQPRDLEARQASNGGPKGAWAMAEINANPVCNIYLLGTLSIVDSEGVVRTPRAQKARALVALLALAPRGARSRVWLRDKLWSESAEEQASASLRQALTDLRKSLGELADDLLASDNFTVSLDLTRIEVDALDPANAALQGDDADAAPDLLEGLDIGDPEFEDWLTLERQVWRSRLENVAVQRPVVPKIERSNSRTPPLAHMNGQNGEPPARDERWAVALIPAAITGDVGGLPDQLSHLLVQSLLESGDFRVLDLSQSDTGDSSDFAPVALTIAPRYRVAGSQIHVNITLARTMDKALLWMGGTTLDRRAIEHGETSGWHQFLNEAIDRLRDFFHERSRLGTEEAGPGETLFAAVNGMFRLSRGDLERSERVLHRIIATRPSGQAYAWLSFLLTFRVGQRFADWASTIEAAQEYGRKALELDPSNAVSLALVGHVHSYLFGEYDFASGLLERAIRANPAQPLSWDLYSMLQAYAGDPRTGLKMASWGRHLGESSPYRYYFDTSRCINAALAGDHDAAIAAGESALRDRPDFNSLLRYLVASHAHRGDMRAAGSFLERLNQVEPDFSVGALVDARYPIMQTEGGRNLIDGLIKAGVKK